MRYTGNQARTLLAAMLAMPRGAMPQSARRWYERQNRKLSGRETRRMLRLAGDPIAAAQRVNAAADRRQRRAIKRHQDYRKCLANNPCLGQRDRPAQ